MVSLRKYLQLEGEIPQALDEVLGNLPARSEAATLFSDGNKLYEVHEAGITCHRKARYANGDPVTRSHDISRESFLAWVFQQPKAVQQQVYHNLRDYLSMNAQEQKFPQPEYL